MKSKDLGEKVSECRSYVNQNKLPINKMLVITSKGEYSFCNLSIECNDKPYTKFGLKHGCEYLGSQVNVEWDDGLKWKMYRCKK